MCIKLSFEEWNGIILFDDCSLFSSSEQSNSFNYSPKNRPIRTFWTVSVYLYIRWMYEKNNGWCHSYVMEKGSKQSIRWKEYMSKACKYICTFGDIMYEKNGGCFKKSVHYHSDTPLVNFPEWKCAFKLQLWCILILTIISTAVSIYSIDTKTVFMHLQILIVLISHCLIADIYMKT